jgi:arylsulfatase
VSWPDGIDASCNGQTRTQFHHVIDITPTLLELLGIDMPSQVKGVEQQPVEGTSMAYTFSSEAQDADAVPTARTSQYFEMFGHRAIWSKGWKAVTYHQAGLPLDADEWELYHLDRDFSEMHDLAVTEPDRLAEMIDLFWSEAERYGVLPIDGRQITGLFAGHRTAGTPRDRDTFVFHPPIDRIPMDAAPSLGARSWALRADIDRAHRTQGGVILAVGTINNGMTVYIKENRLVFDHNYFSDHTTVRSETQLAEGRVTLGVDLERVRRGPARVRLLLDDRQIGEGVIPQMSVMISSVGMDIGRNPSGVVDDYVAPFEFVGDLRRVEIAMTPAMPASEEIAAEIVAALGTQ